ncbi:MAG: phosphotransferase family protein [Sphingobium sp.]
MGRDPEYLKSVLRAHLVSGDKITGIRQLAAGHTNETYLVEGLNQILRMPPAGAPLLDSFDMWKQFQLYAVVKGLPGGPPVPRVTYYCDDLSVLGAPFFLMGAAPGEPFPEYECDPWLAEASPDFRGNISRQWVEAIGGLANQEPIEMLGPIRSPQEEMHIWRRYSVDAGNDALTTQIDRLLAMNPKRSGPPAVVHGDPKLGNTLWNDGKLSVLLDWEMSSNGEPLNDLGYMLYFFASESHPFYSPNCDLPGLWGREQIIAGWQAVTGRPVEGILWYEAMSAAKITAIMAYGHHLALTGQTDDQRMHNWEPYVLAGVEMTQIMTDAIDRSGEA